ncbi:DUF4173 domain-containing protein [Streptomyces radiopugnans]|uniref:Uncharacterized protein n=1 Tax=Streptomyces radiopugnans TaxID=403935 RepID=A0A1H9J388_9ACTN|nr:DUF4173 domain-containing protein [Streptomyces radiopugnans]SEQ81324.1 protein of unknown function [Streptomyces radiopugnans]
MSDQPSGVPAENEADGTLRKAAVRQEGGHEDAPRREAAPGDAGPPRSSARMTKQAAAPGGRRSDASHGASHGASSWAAYEPPPPPAWVTAAKPEEPPPIGGAALWAVLATGTLAGLLLGDGLGLNVLLAALPAALAAYFAGRAAGRGIHPWSLVWAAGGTALLLVPALRDAGWPTFLALAAALATGSLALHGTRTWRGTLIGCVGVFGEVLPGVLWAWHGLRERADGSRDRWWPVVRTAGVAVVLLAVFGALFAGADAAFADLLAGLVPEVSVSDGPAHALLFVLGAAAALGAARTAAAPWRWDRVEGGRGRPRGRMEWALPLVVLNALFAVFIAIQLAVLFGGYDKVLSETGLTYSEYARQGFWQLLTVTLLTLVVIALALRWAPRGAARDRTLVRAVLGVLCALTLVVVLSALRRMELYVDAYGLTRLRVSVAGIELWFGIVIVLIMAAGVFGGRWLPRAVVASAAAAVLCFGLVSPDGLVAEQNVRRFERTGQIDLAYLRGLSADAVPALDTLPEPQRSCALRDIARDVLDGDKPWYATSYGETRARAVLTDRPADRMEFPCWELDREGRTPESR